MVRRLPSRSATISSSPIGVCNRSTSSARGSVFRLTMGGHPEMLGGIGVPRPPRGWGVVLRCNDHRLAFPVTGSAQAGTLGDQRCELGIAGEVAGDGDEALLAIELDAAMPHIVLDPFRASRRASRQSRQHARPVIGWPVSKP